MLGIRPFKRIGSLKNFFFQLKMYRREMTQNENYSDRFPLNFCCSKYVISILHFTLNVTGWASFFNESTHQHSLSMNYREHQRSSTNVLCVEFNEFQSDIETFWSLWEWADVELNGLKSLEMPPNGLCYIIDYTPTNTINLIMQTIFLWFVIPLLKKEFNFDCFFVQCILSIFCFPIYWIEIEWWQIIF